jgi:hypothetical protein
LNTPEGWARANLLLRTLQAPPPRGSLQEWALIFLLDRLEDIEHARFRALAQLTIDKKEGVKAFEDYMNIAFPSLAIRKKQKEEETKAVMKAWVGRGPMKVTPLVPLGKSKLKGRITKVITDHRSTLYKKMNEVMGGYHGQ